MLLLGVLRELNWPTVKIALAEIGPWTLRASALSLASLALVALTLIRGGTLRIRRAYWWGTAAFGTLIVPAVGSSPTINVISANSAVPQPPDE